MQMCFGYADDDTPEPLGHGRAFIILTGGTDCDPCVNPRLEKTRTNGAIFTRSFQTKRTDQTKAQMPAPKQLDEHQEYHYAPARIRVNK